MNYLRLKPVDCPDAPPNIEPPSGDDDCGAAEGDPKEAKVGCVAVASEGWEPNPPNEKPVGSPDDFDCVLKPEKTLPNAGAAPNPELPVVAAEVEVADGVNPKPLLADVDVGAVELAPNPPNTEPEGAEDVAPNPPPNILGEEGEVCVVKLPPNGDVAEALAPNPLPNEPGLGAEVVEAVVAVANPPLNGLEVGAVVVVPNPPLNGLEVEVVAAPNILVVGAEVVAAGAPPNPLPNELVVEVVGVPNVPVVGAEVVAVVVTLPNPIPKGLGVKDVAVPNGLVLGTEFVAVEPLAPNAPLNGLGADVVVAVAVLLNGIMVEEDDKLSGAPPNAGFEPNELEPVDIIGLVVGEVD